MIYFVLEVDWIVKVVFEFVQEWWGQFCLVDKVNVFDVSQFWWDCVDVMVFSYGGVEVSYMYVDNVVM